MDQGRGDSYEFAWFAATAAGNFEPIAVSRYCRDSGCVDVGTRSESLSWRRKSDVNVYCRDIFLHHRIVFSFCGEQLIRHFYLVISIAVFHFVSCFRSLRFLVVTSFWTSPLLAHPRHVISW